MKILYRRNQKTGNVKIFDRETFLKKAGLAPPDLPPPGPWELAYVFWPRRSFFDNKWLRGTCAMRKVEYSYRPGDSMTYVTTTKREYCTVAQAAMYNLTGGKQ